MNSIVKWTILQRRASIILWCVGMVAFVVLVMSLYPTFKDAGSEIDQSLTELPDAAVQLLGGSTDMFSPIGYTNSQVYFISLPLLLGILAISLGSKILAKEESDLTIESLLTRPVSRTKLLGAKAISATIVLAIVSLVTAVSMVVSSNLVNLGIASLDIALASLICFLLTLSFGAIAFVVTAIGKSSGLALGLATILAFGGYLIDSLAGVVDWLQLPAKALPFHYYQSESILMGEYSWWNSIFFIGLIAVCAIISWLAFRRRDLR